MKTASPTIYRQNRSRFRSDELSKYDGQWVAFSADGQRIVASAPTIAALHAQLGAAGENLQEVVLERIEAETAEINLGGAELQ